MDKDVVVNLDEKLSELLSGEQGELYIPEEPKDCYPDFFNILLLSSFAKNHLSMDEHFISYQHMSEILNDHVLGKRELSPEYISNIVFSDDYGKILRFCDSVVFFSGFFPGMFKEMPLPHSFYKENARSGYQNLHRANPHVPYHLPMSVHMDKYIHALHFIRENYLQDVSDDKRLIN